MANQRFYLECRVATLQMKLVLLQLHRNSTFFCSNT